MHLKYLNSLSIDKFEKFCVHFLEGLGFVNLQLKPNIETSKIQGFGYIELGVLSQRFFFLINQNYEVNSVSLISEIRNLMDTSTNKGLIISTGKFSREIKKESKRKGETPIDLIDGEILSNRLTKMKPISL